MWQEDLLADLFPEITISPRKKKPTLFDSDAPLHVFAPPSHDAPLNSFDLDEMIKMCSPSKDPKIDELWSQYIQFPIDECKASVVPSVLPVPIANALIKNIVAVKKIQRRKPKRPTPQFRSTHLYACPFEGCSTDATFTSFSKLKTHIMKAHRQVVKGEICVECGLGFERRSDMLRHLKARHIKDIMSICGDCRRGFARKDAVFRHQRSSCASRIMEE